MRILAFGALVPAFRWAGPSAGGSHRGLARPFLTLIIFLAPAVAGLDPARGAPPDDADAAKRLYGQYCRRCHGADGKGAPGAADGLPDFSRRAWQDRRSDAQLTVSILDGKGAVMPSFRGRLGEAQAKALVAHVRSLAPARPAAPAVVPAAREDDFEAQFRRLQEEYDELKRQLRELDDAEARRARPAPAARSADRAAGAEGMPTAAALFRQHCQRCHGADGRGDPKQDGVPDFGRPDWQKRHSDAQVLASILDGTDGGMPAFRRQLGEAQAKALVAHIRRLAADGEMKRESPSAVTPRQKEKPNS
jgi:mono/diheme cytochrome c family protein